MAVVKKLVSKQRHMIRSKFLRLTYFTNKISKDFALLSSFREQTHLLMNEPANFEIGPPTMYPIAVKLEFNTQAVTFQLIRKGAKTEDDNKFEKNPLYDTLR